MKKIVYAWIEQVLEFDSEMEYLVFQHDLENSGKKYEIVSHKKLKNGKCQVHVMKQYNNNKFPEGGES